MSQPFTKLKWRSSNALSGCAISYLNRAKNPAQMPLRRDLPYEEAMQLHRRQDTAGGSDPKARR